METEPILKQALDKLYAKYNHKKWIHPDPLEFLYQYQDKRDREIVGLIASSLAYGRVKQILKSVAQVLDRMHRPYGYLLNTNLKGLKRDFAGFKHRFTHEQELVDLLWGVKKALMEHHDLEQCFVSGMDGDMVAAMGAFAEKLLPNCWEQPNSLIPHPLKNSACKRLNLYLRWMVRKDRVDPGLWSKVAPSRLIVPLDTHMLKTAHALGFCLNKQGNMGCAVKITQEFQKICPQDPVRYDFCLTRLGIRGERDLAWFLDSL